MKKRRFNRRFWLKLALCAAPVAVAADAVLWEPAWIKVRTRRLTGEKTRHRFVHVSDLHHKGDRKYLEGMVAKINAVSPEFVCFTGDLVEEGRHLAEALEILGRIKAPVFGVPGNHDYWSQADFPTIEASFAKSGGGWLLDRQMSAAGGAILLGGTACNGPLELRPRKGMKNLLLMHYPEHAGKVTGEPFDLMLAGHSHGGQVRIPFLGALIVPGRVGKYELGMYQTAGGPLHVSSGIGWFYLPIRFNCRPEITVFEI